MANKNKTVLERFMEHVKVPENLDECWVWTGAPSKKGYGMFKLAGKTVQAHRLSWELFHGPIPEGKQVLHKCDNPPCVNPSHHYLGDNDQNVQDRVDRHRSSAGVNHPESKLTEEQVRYIRNKYWPWRYPASKLAAELGVTSKTIIDVVKRRTYKEIK